MSKGTLWKISYTLNVRLNKLNNPVSDERNEDTHKEKTKKEIFVDQLRFDKDAIMSKRVHVTNTQSKILSKLIRIKEKLTHRNWLNRTTWNKQCQAIVEWQKIRFTLPNIHNPNHNLKVTGKTRLALKDRISANDVNITNLHHLHYSSPKISIILCDEKVRKR